MDIIPIMRMFWVSIPAGQAFTMSKHNADASVTDLQPSGGVFGGMVE
jgi:hypothetical protein